MLPIAIFITVIGLKENPVISTLSSVLVIAGGPLILAGFVRNKGLALQKSLYSSWGGVPTTKLLRLRELCDNSAIRTAWRDNLTRVTGVRLLSQGVEHKFPEKADQTIEVGVTVLRERTRNRRRFNLLMNENRTYGFERNLLAMRSFGLAFTGIVGMLLTLSLLAVCLGWIELAAPSIIIGLVADLIVLAVWWRYPTSARVHSAALKYAESLLNSASAIK